MRHGPRPARAELHQNTIDHVVYRGPVAWIQKLHSFCSFIPRSLPILDPCFPPFQVVIKYKEFVRVCDVPLAKGILDEPSSGEIRVFSTTSNDGNHWRCYKLYKML
jgi:hypothetical protein